MRKITLKDLVVMNNILYKYYIKEEIDWSSKFPHINTNISIKNFYANSVLIWLKDNEASELFLELSLEESNNLFDRKEELEIEDDKNEFLSKPKRKILTKDVIKISTVMNKFFEELRINYNDPFVINGSDEDDFIGDVVLSCIHQYINYEEVSDSIWDLELNVFSKISDALFVEKKKTSQ